MPWTPDRAVVINLARRPDRLATFRRDWAASGWDSVLGTPQVVVGVDGLEGPVAASKAAGAYGCWASHVQVLQAALEDGVQQLLVFEDDAIPRPESQVWLSAVLRALPQEAAGLWLDACVLGTDNRFMAGSFGTSRLIQPPLRTHAYLLPAAVIEQVAPLVAAKPGHIDHAYRRAFAKLGLAGTVFAANPSLALQGDSPSDTRSAWRQVFSDPQRSNDWRLLRAAASKV